MLVRCVQSAVLFAENCIMPQVGDGQSNGSTGRLAVDREIVISKVTHIVVQEDGPIRYKQARGDAVRTFQEALAAGPPLRSYCSWG